MPTEMVISIKVKAAFERNRDQSGLICFDVSIGWIDLNGIEIGGRRGEGVSVVYVMQRQKPFGGLRKTRGTSREKPEGNRVIRCSDLWNFCIQISAGR